EFDGRTGLELLFEAAGPELAVELDLARVARAGHDPAAFLGRIRGCVLTAHAKDNARERQAQEEHGLAAVGQGAPDWEAILPAAAGAGVQWYIIVHELPRDAAAVVKTGATYLREHLPTDNQLSRHEQADG